MNVRVCASRRGDQLSPASSFVSGATLVGMTGLAWKQTWNQRQQSILARSRHRGTVARDFCLT